MGESGGQLTELPALGDSQSRAPLEGIGAPLARETDPARGSSRVHDGQRPKG